MANNKNRTTQRPTKGRSVKPVATGKGSKFMRREEEISDTAERGYKSKSNDIAWYSRYPASVRDAGSTSWGAPLGKALTLKSGGTALNDYDYIAPGVVAIHWVPTIGVSKDKSSPINRGALNLFVNLRSKQKAAKDYDSQDMMMGIIAIDSLYTFYAFCRRVYGIARASQTPMNYYYTRQLLTAMGVDADDAIKNLANFRTWLNIFGVSLGKYTLPKDLDMTSRHMWMSDGLYLDADDLRAQTYMFVPDAFLLYDNTVTTGSQLIEAVPNKTGANNTYTTSNLMSFGDLMLSRVNGDDDIGWICGDMYAAYGSAAMRPLEAVSPEYMVVPSYNEEVLAQIENIKFCGQFNSITISQNPTVNNGAILQDPSFHIDDPAATGDATYNYHMYYTTMLNNHDKQSPDPAKTIEMTRLTPIMDYLSEASHVYKLKACGTEVCTYYQIFALDSQNNLVASIKCTNSFGISVDATWAGAAIEVLPYMQLEAFDWHWMSMLLNVGSASSSINSISWDVDNITTISDDDVAWMHEVALVSEFDMPSVMH